jgi:hypothetical protein
MLYHYGDGGYFIILYLDDEQKIRFRKDEYA